MTLPLELPQPIHEELTLEAQREGVSELDHAALLVCLASAFKQEVPNTPFQQAVRRFVSHHALDADRVFSVFEQLVHLCMEAPDEGNTIVKSSTGEGKTAASVQHALLKHWRNASVHQPADESYDVLLTDVAPLDTLEQTQGRVSRELPLEKEGSDPRDRVRQLIKQWQTDDNTPVLPSIATRADETPTQALFRKWEEEDACMSEVERQAEDQLWEDFQQGIDAERSRTGMRKLF